MAKSIDELLDTLDSQKPNQGQMSATPTRTKTTDELLDALDGVNKPVPTSAAEPQVDTRSDVNVAAYDPVSIFGKLVPKASEKPQPKEPPKFVQGGDTSFKDDQKATDLAFDVLKNKYPIAASSYLLQATNMMGGVRLKDASPDLATAVKAGFRQSVMGKRGVALGYKEPFELTSKQYESMSGPAKFAYSLASFGGDIPAFIFGGLVGSTVGGPVGAMGGGFATAEGLRSYYDQMIEKGEIKGPVDFLKRVNDVGVAELKGMVTGKLTGETGAAGSKAAGAIGRLTAEAATLTTVPSILESRLPSTDDFYNTASFLLGMNLIVRGPSTIGKMRKLFVKTGMTPKEVVEVTKVDPELKQALTDETTEIPEDVLAKAKAKVDAAVKVQADLAAAEKVAKNPTTAEEVVKEELKVKGKKVKKAKGIKVDEPAVEEKSVQSLNGLEETPAKSATELIEPEPVKSATELIEPAPAKPKVIKRKASAILTPEQWQAEANKVEGVKFNGIQETGIKGKAGIPLFTLDRPDITPTTFSLEKGETIEQAVARKYKQAKSVETGPITDTDLQTGTPMPEALKPGEHPFRDKDPKHTNEMSRLYIERIKKADIDPEVFTRYLINEVNRWLNGEEPATPIEKIRNGLSNAAVNAENARNKFDTTKDFNEWKDTVIEAARWARESDRLTIKRTGGTTLSMGIDPTQIPEHIRNLSEGIKELFRTGIRKRLGDDTVILTGRTKEKTDMVMRQVLIPWSKEQIEKRKAANLPIGEGLYSWVFEDQLKPVERGGTQLNMMIPVNELPERVKEILRTLKVGIETIKKGTDYVFTGEDDKVIPLNSIYRNKEVFDKTGFWLGKDGKWRYEIGDEGLKLKKTMLSPDRYSLQEVIEHPSLYEAIPELKDVQIGLNKKMKAEGQWISDQKVIEVNNPDKDTIVHELQHAVNDIMKSKFRGSNVEVENAKLLNAFLKELKVLAKTPELKRELENIDIAFNMGMGPKGIVEIADRLMKKSPTDAKDISSVADKYLSNSAFENYMKDPGEMEARLASRRREMSAEERKEIPPWGSLEYMLQGERLASTGFKLYSGLDPTEATRQIIKGAKDFMAYMDKARGMKSFKPGEAFKQVREEIVRSGIDRSGNIRKEFLDNLGDTGYGIVQEMVLVKGAPSLSAQKLKQLQKEIYDGLSTKERRVLDSLIEADRMADIASYKNNFKFPEGISTDGKVPDKSIKYRALFQQLEGLNDDQVNILNTRAKGYFEWMKVPLKDLLGEELISQEEYDLLVSHNYRRLKLVDVYDKQYQTKLGKKIRTVYDSGVQALAHGRETDIFEPSSEVMALEVFNRVYGRIFNNAANRNLLDLARENKDNPFVAVKDSPKDRIPSGWDRIYVYEKGERKALYLSPEVSKEWITQNPEMSYKMSQFLRWVSGSAVLRTFATGIDWGFALANLPRDIMHIWFAARVFDKGEWKPLYSSAMPVYAGQMTTDIATVFSDALLRGKKYQDYIKEGGGMEFLVHQGRLLQRGRHVEGGMDKIMNFLGYLGETSEIMTRLAIRDRVIKRRAAERGIGYEEAAKNKKITQEATFAARDYMDFGQGGSIAKGLDNALPYLNASIQGTRGLLRSLKDDPWGSSMKLAQFTALVAGLYIASQSTNPETMKALKGSLDPQGNLIIPLGDGFGFDDEKGQRRYPYLKIPLDPGQKFFKTFIEGATDKMLGNEVDVKGITNSLTQISPVSISSLPPTVGAVMGYYQNKDSWNNEEIWRKTDKPLSWPNSKEEYIPGQTPNAMVDVGALTGLSPERLKYALSELFTGGTIWGWLVGQGYDAAFHSLDSEKKQQHLAQTLAKTPMVKRFFGITNPYAQFQQSLAQAQEDAMIKRWQENRGLDQVAQAYLFDNVGNENDVHDYVRQYRDSDTRDRLDDRWKFQKNTRDLSNRSFWLSLKSITDTEARAKVYVDRLEKASSKEYGELMEEKRIVQKAGGIFSDEFNRAVNKIRSGVE